MDTILPDADGPRVYSASNRNEYQEYFLGGGGGGQRRPVRGADNLHVSIVLNSGSLNLPEPSGPVQARNGMALSFKGLGACVRCAWHSCIG
jgi:hypothetical protein